MRQNRVAKPQGGRDFQSCVSNAAKANTASIYECIAIFFSLERPDGESVAHRLHELVFTLNITHPRCRCRQ
eukprot:5206759-Pyramimonas_sp.AAC.1